MNNAAIKIYIEDSCDFTEAFEYCQEYLYKYGGKYAQIVDQYGLVWDSKTGMNIKNR